MERRNLIRGVSADSEKMGPTLEWEERGFEDWFLSDPLSSEGGEGTKPERNSIAGNSNTIHWSETKLSISCLGEKNTEESSREMSQSLMSGTGKKITPIVLARGGEKGAEGR